MDRASSGPGERSGRAGAVRLLHVTDESTPSPDPTATDAAGTKSPKSADDSSAQPKQPKADPGQIPADSDVARLQGLRPTGIPLAEARA